MTRSLMLVTVLLVMFLRSEIKRMESYEVGFPAQQYLGVTLGIDGPPKEILTPETKARLRAATRNSSG